MPKKRLLSDTKLEDHKLPEPYGLQYHASFNAAAICNRLTAYFHQLEMLLYREEFPSSKSSALPGLVHCCRGHKSLIWRNRSLVMSRANPTPEVWDNASKRIKIDDTLLMTSSTATLDQIAKHPSDTSLNGFFMHACLVFRSSGRKVYTPIMGGWIAASSTEDFKDRELKGFFSLADIPPPVQRELQLAFLMRLLIDAMWWKVTPEDKSADSNRFVSVPIQDLALFPREAIEILEDMDQAAQHYDLEDETFQHHVSKCKCQVYKDCTTKTHLLLGTSGLRKALQDMSHSKTRSTTDSVTKSVFHGIPSLRVGAAIKFLKQTYRKPTTKALENHAVASKTL
eukprot:Blabericola_migrator_1__10667@NODE_608_length_7306_cov_258_002348_g441_i0_p4_GENE_NODE_608_length_7306_cov_258_002348_g441_i0NODE_608_length_7306_cov_258_002348_g441_i0_p4_ORF_typecomplete_len340_score61_47_NODE_608_length_7306_cov_258_002348_g441_i025913610